MDIFSYHDYRDFIKDFLDSDSKHHGIRSRLAKALRCQNSFVSQVTNKTVHLSFDHAILAAQFLNLTGDKRHYFMALVQQNRAGSKELERYYDEQLEEIKSRQLMISERIQSSHKVTKQDQSTYYSNWWYVAAHILTAFPQYSTPELIAAKLGMPLQIIESCLEFLVSKGFILKNENKLSIGNTRIHLEAKSPMIARHHTNWRLQSVKAIETMNANNLHYSSVIGVSLEDARKIKQEILNLLEKKEKILKTSKEESAFVFLLDFFEM